MVKKVQVWPPPILSPLYIATAGGQPREESAATGLGRLSHIIKKGSPQQTHYPQASFEASFREKLKGNNQRAKSFQNFSHFFHNFHTFS